MPIVYKYLCRLVEEKAKYKAFTCYRKTLSTISKESSESRIRISLRLSFFVIGLFSPVCPSLTGRKIWQYMNITEDVYKNFQDHWRLYESRNKLQEGLGFSGRILRISPRFHKSKQKLFGLIVSPSKNTHIVTQLLFRSVP
jgi:hypothetical protein